jgi:hypothetical protein
MILSRRNALIGLGLSGTALLIPSSPARADLATENWPVLRPLLARHWQGFGQTQSAGTENGKLTLALAVDLGPGADMRINGRLRMTSQWQTGTYTAVYGLGGYCWGTNDEVGVLIDRAIFESGDSLPEQLYWQGLTGKLHLARERGSETGLLLSGTLYGTQDGNAFETQLSDHD